MSQLSQSDLIETVIVPRTNDIGNFEVQRVLPHKTRRMVGPFIFWDQIGDGLITKGEGIDVRPHPHIGLSTLTYLFKGHLMHRDSLGNDIKIEPGEVNLMTSGSGVVHSERTDQDLRTIENELYGIQSWIALPKKYETGGADFKHYKADQLTSFSDKQVSGKLLMGNYQGLSSVLDNPFDGYYLDLYLDEGGVVETPKHYEENAIYVLSGEIEIDNRPVQPEQMIVLKNGLSTKIKCLSKKAHIILLGGASMDGHRYIWWNFVASNKELLKDACDRWLGGQFPQVPSDNKEFIPLPDKPNFDALK